MTRLVSREVANFESVSRVVASFELVICEMVSREWMSSEQYNNVDCKVSSD